jgi:hypothetical protein
MNQLRIVVFCSMMLWVAATVWCAPVPDTGQKKCYDAVGDEIDCPSSGQPFYGQDGTYDFNPMTYIKLDGKGDILPDSAASWVMVKDNITGLIWEMKTNKDGVQNYDDPHDADNTYTWYDSNSATNGGYAGTPGNGTDTEDFIKALNDARFGGYTDWRMPTIKELAYITNYSILSPGPAIDSGSFPNTMGAKYWSATSYFYSTSARTIDFESVSDGYSLKANVHCVRAVRGEDAQSSMTNKYHDNGDGDGTVTDQATGLMWQKDISEYSNYMTWEKALAYCESLSLGGYSDWRMPTVKELRSMVNYSLFYPAVDTTFFPEKSSRYWSSHWTSTTVVNNTGAAWIIGFLGYDYGSGSIDKRSSSYVRAVRGGQSRMLGDLVISPLGRMVSCGAGSAAFSVVNTGTGTIAWEAAVIAGSDWLSITSGNSGNDSGTITCSYSGNISDKTRTGIIRITANNDHLDVSLTQDPALTPCTATIDAALSLHIPLLDYLIPPWTGTPTYHAEFIYDYNAMFPDQIIFALTDVGTVHRSDFSCSPSSILMDPSSWTVDALTISILDMKFIGDATRYWVDLEYSPLFSTDSKICFVVIGYGVY